MYCKLLIHLFSCNLVITGMWNIVQLDDISLPAISSLLVVPRSVVILKKWILLLKHFENHCFRSSLDPFYRLGMSWKTIIFLRKKSTSWLRKNSNVCIPSKANDTWSHFFSLLKYMFSFIHLLFHVINGGLLTNLLLLWYLVFYFAELFLPETPSPLFIDWKCTFSKGWVSESVMQETNWKLLRQGLRKWEGEGDEENLQLEKIRHRKTNGNAVALRKWRDKRGCRHL